MDIVVSPFIKDFLGQARAGPALSPISVLICMVSSGAAEETTDSALTPTENRMPVMAKAQVLVPFGEQERKDKDSKQERLGKKEPMKEERKSNRRIISAKQAVLLSSNCQP